MDDIEIVPISKQSKSKILQAVIIDRDKFYEVCKGINPEITERAFDDIYRGAEICLTYYKKMAEDEKQRVNSQVKKEANKSFEEIDLMLGKLISRINEIHTDNDYAASRLIFAATTFFAEHFDNTDFDNSAALPMYEQIIQSLIVIKEIAEIARVDIPRHAPEKVATNYLAKQAIFLFEQLRYRAKKGYRNQQKNFLKGLLESSDLTTQVKLSSFMSEIDDINKKHGNSQERISSTPEDSAEQKIKREWITKKWK